MGTSPFDALTPLMDWVEKGVAPNRILASRVVENKAVRTRPLCPYPQVAKYKGGRQHRGRQQLYVRETALNLTRHGTVYPEAMQTGTIIPVEEYLASDYSPDCDYVDGQLQERNVGEYDHAKLQAVLTTYLLAREKQWAVDVMTEQRVQVSATRYRVPDICVAARPGPQEPILREPPFICIEILSPADSMRRMQERIDDYLAMGVPHIWLLDPQTRRAYTCARGAILEAIDGVLRTENPDVIVPLAEIWK